MDIAAITGEDIRTGAAAIAVGVSLISLAITRMQAQKAERFGRRPVLVVRTNRQNTEWEIENIGKGPALDVVLFQRVSANWRPLLMPDLAADGRAPIPPKWFEQDHPDLILRYRSIADRERYLTKVHDDRAEISRGWKDAPVIAGLRSHREYL
jgi:hypothetical protein